MEYQTYTLPNGIRLIHKPDYSPVCHCGMVINTGSRDENEPEQGLAHFVEHLLFKGTNRRNSRQIINKLEHVGGELNAYTSKEETVVYAAVLCEHLEKAVDLIGNIVLNSTFPLKEIEKERVIILDEIQSYNDSPSELIYDDFEELLFNHHPIGHNILGRPDLLEQYSREDLSSFFSRNYLPEEMVFYVIGKVDDRKLIKWAEKYFLPEKNTPAQKVRIKPVSAPASSKVIKKDTFQVHYMLGNRAFDLHHPDRIGMYLLNNILGGPGMNSLLNLSLREKHGLVYTVDSAYQPLTDTGVWMVYFGCDEKNFKKCNNLVRTELSKLMNDRLSENTLKKYKYQLLGQMAISSENKENLGVSMGKSLLRYGKVDTLQVLRESILAVSAEKLQGIACEIFDDAAISTLKYE